MPSDLVRVRRPYILYDLNQDRHIDTAWMFAFEAEQDNSDFRLNSVQRVWIEDVTFQDDTSMSLFTSL